MEELSKNTEVMEEVMEEKPVIEDPTSIMKTKPKKARSEAQKIAFAACQAKLSETRRLRKELKLKKQDGDSKIKKSVTSFTCRKGCIK